MMNSPQTDGPVPLKSKLACVALVGQPNSGKTALFNSLSGLRRKVANYPGVTVELAEGLITLLDGTTVRLFDLPGTYSLNPVSED